MAIDESLYYNFTPLLSRNGVFNFVTGGRGIGKSFGAKEMIVRNAIKKGHQFIYLRRFKEELKTSADSFFADLVAKDKFPGIYFRKMGHEAQYTRDPEDAKDRKWVTMGYFLALSIAQTYKSVSYPSVRWMVFDEFIAEAGRRYISDEARAMVNFYNTVDRYEDRVRVLFLANAVSIMNPYFLEYNIVPDGREFISAGEGFVVCHFPEMDDFNDETRNTRFGRFIAGTSYETYAVDNEFADNHTNLLGKRPATARYLYTIDTTKGRFRLWFDTVTGEYHVEEKALRGGEIVFTLDPQRVTQDVLYIMKHDNRLEYPRTAFRNGRMIFDKAKTRNIFLELFK